MITSQLLEGLLSPTHRQQAERHLELMSIVDKAKGLIAILPQLVQVDQVMLTAILLRRQVALLGEQVFLRKVLVSQASLLLQDMVDPLLLFFGDINNTARRQIGHVLAELCSTLSVLSLNESQVVLNKILERIAPTVSCFYFGVFYFV
jgi:hypothetical protein